MNYLEKAIAAENLDKLSKIVDEALDLGIRVNARNEDGFSFTNVTMFKMYRDEFKENKQEDIIRKLALNGADFNVQGERGREASGFRGRSSPRHQIDHLIDIDRIHHCLG